jgi:excisionase family DNA binding protein
MTKTDNLSQMIEAACEAAIKRALRPCEPTPRRLLSARESAQYLSLSQREVCSMIAERQLAGIRYGRRLMIDIRDLESWVLAHKAL